MEKEVRIRPAKREDLESIISMLADDPLGSTREDFQVPLPACYKRAFSVIENDPFQELMVAVKEGEVIGTFQLTFIQYLTYRGGIRAQIEAVRVKKNHRGSGIGELMFRSAIERAQQKGAHLLQLTTDKKRPEAKRFYEKLGFIASHEGMKLHF